MVKILVVEDDAHIRKTIKAALQKEHYLISEAENGQEALDLFHSGAFDLILLDMIMPVLDGEAVLREVRKTHTTPIIIISAINDELAQVEAFTHKVDDYVVKPFSMNILIHKIKALLRRVYGEADSTIVYGDLTLYVNN